jgi:hypothetical protein
MGDLTLDEFCRGVHRIQRQRHDQGVVRAYFKHQTIAPDNVIVVWDDIGGDDVPADGTELDTPGHGRTGEDTRWRVLSHEWLPGAAVILAVTDS